MRKAPIIGGKTKSLQFAAKAPARPQSGLKSRAQVDLRLGKPRRFPPFTTENLPMLSLRPLAAILLALSLAACAAQSQPDLTPPPKKPLDAKTQLETGR
jgi:hypothetical protein